MYDFMLTDDAIALRDKAHWRKSKPPFRKTRVRAGVFGDFPCFSQAMDTNLF